MFRSLYKHPDSHRDILGLMKKDKPEEDFERKNSSIDMQEERIKNSAFKEKRVALTSRNH